MAEHKTENAEVKAEDADSAPVQPVDAAQPELKVETTAQDETAQEAAAPADGAAAKVEEEPSVAPTKPETASTSAAQKKEHVKMGYCTFRQVQDCLGYFKRLLSNSAVNVDMNEYEHLALLDLLKSHPDSERKLGVGVRGFQVREFSIPDDWKTARAFYAIRKDGTAEDFSYIKCTAQHFPGQTVSQSHDGKRSHGGGDGPGAGRRGGRGRGGGSFKRGRR